MSDPKPPIQVDLAWDRELRFTVRSGDAEFALDGNQRTGPSPMQALAAALAGCMAIDLVHILSKGRQPPVALQARLIGERADTEPRRFERIRLHYTVQGSVPAGTIDRAIALSREKYCSV
ncbi:MAG TPA: OsmC family protein, partial [Vicinamibacterales bacterium]